MRRKFHIDLLCITLLVALPGLVIWFRGADWLGLVTVEQRAAWIVGLCAAFMVLLAWCSFDAASRPAAAARRIVHGLGESLGRNPSAPDTAAPLIGLKDQLRRRYGRRWQYRDRWLLVSGDPGAIDAVSPDLRAEGYAITPGVVLLYAEPDSLGADRPGIDWLRTIARMRRRRPVDAIVAITHTPEDGLPVIDPDGLAYALAQHGHALGWSAPVYMLHLPVVEGNVPEVCEAMGCLWPRPPTDADAVSAGLMDLSCELAGSAVRRMSRQENVRYLAQLSRYVAGSGTAMAELLTGLGKRRAWRVPVHGLLFTPLFGDGVTTNAEWFRSTWRAVAKHSRQVPGRPVGWSASRVGAWTVTALALLWAAGTLMSYTGNRARIDEAVSVVDASILPGDATQAVHALVALQSEIGMYERDARDGVPWTLRFGMNRDVVLHERLMARYAAASRPVLVEPIRLALESRLRRLGLLTDRALAARGEAEVKAAYDDLQTYLTLARPEHADGETLRSALRALGQPTRPVGSSMSEGTWFDRHQHMIDFYAAHLSSGDAAQRSALAIVADPALVARARQTLVSVIGLQNSVDTVYQQILDENRAKYPPVSLAALLGDSNSRGLFGTDDEVPGEFTRTAWDERIGAAIDKASTKRSVAADWVLVDGGKAAASSAPETLRQALRERYFTDYARAWQQFLNGMRWEADASLSGTVDQLNLLADPQRSPLSALFRVIVFQAGAGATRASLSDNLVERAQQLVGVGEKDPSKIVAMLPEASLAGAFGPLLRLVDSEAGSAGGEMGLSRYLERVTSVRLKLQQIVMSDDPDGMARVAAQAILQGKSSEIADSRDYASRLAASLGQQWSAFGEALFRRPLDQTWQVVVQPAAASLNEAWRTTLVGDWNTAFGARYPFVDSPNDASLPEMARFLRSDGGLIAQFVTTQLAGVIERQGDRWAVAQGVDRQTLRVDPAFLEALNRLLGAANVLFPNGDAQVRYELRAVPSPGVVDMKLKLSGRELHYFNQRESWMPFLWPGEALENRTSLEWQTEEAGLRSGFEEEGRFGLIRLLEKATVTQQDGARHLLTWTPQTSQGRTLQVQLRGEAGAGPLEVLKLRHFVLPARIFMVAGKEPDISPASGNPRAARSEKE